MVNDFAAVLGNFGFEAPANMPHEAFRAMHRPVDVPGLTLEARTADQAALNRNGGVEINFNVWDNSLADDAEPIAHIGGDFDTPAQLEAFLIHHTSFFM